MDKQTTPEEQPVQEAAPEQPEPAARPQESRFRNSWQKLKKFARECQRVLKVIKKPDKQEFLATAKVSAIGLTIVGLIGFALSMVQQALI